MKHHGLQMKPIQAKGLLSDRFDGQAFGMVPTIAEATQVHVSVKYMDTNYNSSV